MSVSFAIKMSMCLPPYFTPMTHENKIYIDGGISRNFPMSPSKGEKTLGLKLSYPLKDINSFAKYVNRIIDIIKNNENKEEYNKNNIIIPINIKPTPTFSLTPLKSTKINLIKFGEQSVKEFFKNI